MRVYCFTPGKRTLVTLARWLCGKESSCHCWWHRRHRFDPWVGKIPWRRKWQFTQIFFPGKSHGQRSLAGYSPWGCREQDTIQQLSTQEKTREELDVNDLMGLYPRQIKLHLALLFLWNDLQGTSTHFLPTICSILPPKVGKYSISGFL